MVCYGISGVVNLGEWNESVLAGYQIALHEDTKSYSVKYEHLSDL